MKTFKDCFSLTPTFTSAKSTRGQNLYLSVSQYILSRIDSKQMISKIVERSFGKEKSVFKDWKSDTPEMILAMVAADLNCWKIEKFVKQGDDVA
jgi:hypothetical protein